MTFGAPDCPLCEGRGGWTDHIAEQTIICHLCRPTDASKALPAMRNPGFVTSRWTTLECKKYGPRFQVAPWLLVLHSGSRAPNVGEYFHDLPDGRVVSAHINWTERENGFTQGVPLNTVAWHVGGSRLRLQGQVNRKLNFCSIGIELPGPWNKVRPETELDALRETVIYLLEYVPSLKFVTRHQDIDSGKRDPGPGFKWDCLADLGLVRVPIT